MVIEVIKENPITSVGIVLVVDKDISSILADKLLGDGLAKELK